MYINLSNQTLTLIGICAIALFPKYKWTCAAVHETPSKDLDGYYCKKGQNTVKGFEWMLQKKSIHFFKGLTKNVFFNIANHKRELQWDQPLHPIWNNIIQGPKNIII